MIIFPYLSFHSGVALNLEQFKTKSLFSHPIDSIGTLPHLLLSLPQSGSFANFAVLAEKLSKQHCKDSHDRSYPWDYWPDEDARSSCDFVGLTNLGATCYMASCMQHLFMVAPAKRGILSSDALLQTTQHKKILVELQKLFAFLSASERKAYNPKSFCKVYTMDKQPLNTGEQKDMTEFFTDLITKLEEMNPKLKSLVKDLFGGVITNNVVSLDCDHVSQTVRGGQ